MLVHDLGTDAFVNDAHERCEEVGHWVCLLVVVRLKMSWIQVKRDGNGTSARARREVRTTQPAHEVATRCLRAFGIQAPGERAYAGALYIEGAA